MPTLTPDQQRQMEQAMARMKEQMAKMPPEQRQKMEEAMGKVPGKSSMGAGGVRFCMSKEMAARREPPKQQGGCDYSGFQRSASSVKFTMNCKADSKRQGEMTSHYDAEVLFEGDKAYTMNMSGTTEVNGQSHPMKMQVKSHWVADDCGNLKPEPMSGDSGSGKP
jgi:hypothetical protein